MARILRQVTVVRDGMHNAFTDLAYWQGAYWVSYRKGAGHISIDGEAVLSVSVDRTRFREAARVKVPGDNRDPKLICLDEEHLSMVFPSWIGGSEKRNLQQYVSFSSDGFIWQEPVPILPANHWLWRVRRHAELFYGLVYSFNSSELKERWWRLEIMTSSDLLHWQPLAYIGDPHDGMNEADIFFRNDGEAWLISRSEVRPGQSVMAIAQPPYTDWEIVYLPTTIHCPVMTEYRGEVYLSGRRMVDIEGDDTFPFLDRASLGVWRVERGQVERVLCIPATGDCAYPGMVVDPEGRVCLSYYSQHAYHMGVVAPPFRLEAEAPYNQGSLLTPNDVYFAELELP
ncbi:MAG: sialidase family protein [bacterium]|jgi:hypothetical protein